MKICLIVEGTYPYITGGVSRWVHDLILGLNEFQFSIIHLRYGPVPDEVRYTPPENVEEIVHVAMEEFHDADFDSIWWESVMRLPRADVYHALATGFAGLLGMQIKNELQRPFLLTEHGIYWREVADGSEELECGFKVAGANNKLFGITAERDHWRKSLREIAAETYQHADLITTVAESNLKYQHELGACSSVCRVIPNGVTIPKTIEHMEEMESPIHFAFVGRVSPIKDIETCLLAMALTRDKIPNARFSIIGPLDHSREYSERMISLAEKLGFDRSLFHGECNPAPVYKSLTALLLTSISEALPYVALEAMSYRVPIISTDVGDCSLLVKGKAGDDAGDAGIIVPVSKPYALSDAMVRLASDDNMRNRMGEVGYERVKRHYVKKRCLDAYRQVYTEMLYVSSH